MSTKKWLDTRLANGRIVCLDGKGSFKPFLDIGDVMICPSVSRLWLEWDGKTNTMIHKDCPNMLNVLKQSLSMTLRGQNTVKSRALVYTVKELGGEELLTAIREHPERWEGIDLEKKVTLTGRTYLCAGVKYCPRCETVFASNRNANTKCASDQHPGEEISLVHSGPCSADRLWWLHSEDGDVQVFLHKRAGGLTTDFKGHSHGSPVPWRLTDDDRALIERKTLVEGMQPVDILRSSDLQSSNRAVNLSKVRNVASKAKKESRAERGYEEITPLSGRKLNLDLYFETKHARENAVGADYLTAMCGIPDEEWISPYYRGISDVVSVFSVGSFVPSSTSRHPRDQLFPSRLNWGSTHLPFNMAVCLQSPAMSFAASISPAVIVDASHKAICSSYLPVKSYAELFTAVNPITERGQPCSRTAMFSESRQAYEIAFCGFFRTLEYDGYVPMVIWESGRMNILVDFHFGQFFGLVNSIVKMGYAPDLQAGIQFALRISKGCNRQHFRKNAMRVIRMYLDEDAREFRRACLLVAEIPMYSEKALVDGGFRELGTLLGEDAAPWVRWWQHPIIRALLCRAYSLNPNFMKLCDTTNYGESLQRESEVDVDKRTPMQQIKYLASCDKKHFYDMKNRYVTGTPVVNRVMNAAAKDKAIARKRARAVQRKVDAQHKGPSSRAALSRPVSVEEGRDVLLEDEDDDSFGSDDDDLFGSDVDDDDDEDEYLVSYDELCDTQIIEIMENIRGSQLPMLKMMNVFGELALEGDRNLLDDPEDEDFDPDKPNPYDPSLRDEEEEEEEEGESRFYPVMDWDLLDEVKLVASTADPSAASQADRSAGAHRHRYFTRTRDPKMSFDEYQIEDVLRGEEKSASVLLSEKMRAIPTKLMFLSQANKLRRARAEKKSEAYRSRRASDEVGEDGEAEGVSRKRKREDSPLTGVAPKRRKIEIVDIVGEVSRGDIVVVEDVGVGTVVLTHAHGMMRVHIHSIFPGCRPNLRGGKGNFSKDKVKFIMHQPHQ